MLAFAIRCCEEKYDCQYLPPYVAPYGGARETYTDHDIQLNTRLFAVCLPVDRDQVQEFNVAGLDFGIC